jgi:hypothetical protein
MIVLFIIIKKLLLFIAMCTYHLMDNHYPSPMELFLSHVYIFSYLSYVITHFSCKSSRKWSCHIDICNYTF